MNAIDLIGEILLHSLWQGCAVALLLRLALRLLPDAPQPRYLAACLAMALLVALPALTPLVVGAAPKAIGSASPAGASTQAPPNQFPPPLAPTMSAAQPTQPMPALRHALVLAWLIGVAVFSLYHTAGWLYLRRLRHRSTRPPAGDWESRLRRLAEQMSVRRPILLLESALVRVPAVIGWLRPIIFVPVGALTGLPPRQLDALLLHELAHVRRHDYLVNLAQVVIETALFYHPATWWISRQIRQEREMCCDDAAVARCGDRLLYAQSLAAMAGLRAAPPAYALAADGGNLSARIRRILTPAPRRGPAYGPSLLIALALLAAVGASFLATSPSRAADKPATTATSKPAASNQPTASPITPEDLLPIDEEYSISASDLVSVRIVRDGQPDATRTARITDKGTLSLPLINDPVRATGLTEAKLRDAIQAKLTAAGVAPPAGQISVSVIEARGAVVMLVGALARPGVYSINKSTQTLTDALKFARIDPQAQTIRVIRRTGPPKPPDKAAAAERMLEIPYAQLQADEAKWNLAIRRGDVVIVEGPPPAAKP
jgi:beta-lactamase regulating signal transducer with metallopeptidase domain/protein involved in polysaccharide export with SLBB domain